MSTRSDLLEYVAPCSLLCYTCPAYEDGVISKHSRDLCKYFEGYYDFNKANLPDKYRSWLKEFESFYKRLKRYSHGSCIACRNNPSAGSGCIENCIVPSCTRENKVDFCGECPNFPCERGKEFFKNINKEILSDWIEGNKSIKAVGIKQYFEEKKEISHYISYK